MPLTVGTTCPAFSLPNQAGETIASTSLKGRYQVLYFYPKDDTPGCTKQANEFTSELAAFEALDSGVYAVSPDSVASHKKFADKHQLKIQLLSDEDKALSKAFGVYEEKSMFGKKYFGITRSTFILDPQGKIVAVYYKVKVSGHVAAVKQKLNELKAGAEA